MIGIFEKLKHEVSNASTTGLSDSIFLQTMSVIGSVFFISVIYFLIKLNNKNK